jgi:hypothetical protein
MEIVPTSNKKKGKIGLEDLIARRTELRNEITNQRQQISLSGKRLFSIDSVTGYIFGAVKKSITVADGVVIGMKVVQTFKRLFGKSK